MSDSLVGGTGLSLRGRAGEVSRLLVAGAVLTALSARPATLAEMAASWWQACLTSATIGSWTLCGAWIAISRLVFEPAMAILRDVDLPTVRQGRSPRGTFFFLTWCALVPMAERFVPPPSLGFTLGATVAASLISSWLAALVGPSPPPRTNAVCGEPARAVEQGLVGAVEGRLTLEHAESTARGVRESRAPRS